ncbi:maltase 1-like [Bacillus rossius redtenbacheri]|uniref:maltase 1-like n=1 Tax=Bacillus rossius redtenbacheri TaxID=93214 RepID=UPI002FDDAF16
MRYWLEEGVDGFRMDAVPFLFEDERLRDEELVGDLSAKSTSEEYPDRYHTQNLPESVEMVQQWRELVDQYTARDNRTRLMVTEAYAKVDKTFQYYGTEDRPGAHFTFNFFLIQMLDRSSGAAAFNRTINTWLQNLPEGRWSNWVMGNHDNGRVASRFPGLADALSALVLWLPGTAVTYYGDELAMEDAPISYQDTIDPLGCAAGPQGYLSQSRDPARTPFQWDDSASAGFSSSEATWLPVHPNHRQLNLARQRQSDDSHYRVYTKLVAERRARTLQRGSATVDALSDNVLAFVRELAGEDTYCVVINMGNSSETVDLTAAFRNIPSRLSIVVASVGSSFARGRVVSSTEITLAEKEFVGLKSSSELCDKSMPLLV